MTLASPVQNNQWQDICALDDLVAYSGVCALATTPDAQKIQVAIFYVPNLPEQVFAIGNYDPIGEANVLYRGIVGSVAEEPVVASPLYKEHYSLLSGQCLEHEEHTVPAYRARLVQDRVQLLLD